MFVSRLTNGAIKTHKSLIGSIQQKCFLNYDSVCFSLVVFTPGSCRVEKKIVTHLFTGFQADIKKLPSHSNPNERLVVRS